MCIVLGCYSTLHFGLVRPPRCQWKFLSKNGWALHPLFVENSQVIIVWLTVWLTSLLAGFDGILQAVDKPCHAMLSKVSHWLSEQQAKGCLIFFGFSCFMWFYDILCVYFASRSQKSASWGIPSDMYWLMWLCSRPSGRLPTYRVCASLQSYWM